MFIFSIVFLQVASSIIFFSVGTNAATVFSVAVSVDATSLAVGWLSEIYGEFESNLHRGIRQR